jgi:hypothetical protein
MRCACRSVRPSRRGPPGVTTRWDAGKRLRVALVEESEEPFRTDAERHANQNLHLLRSTTTSRDGFSRRHWLCCSCLRANAAHFSGHLPAISIPSTVRMSFADGSREIGLVINDVFCSLPFCCSLHTIRYGIPGTNTKQNYAQTRGYCGTF